MWFCTYEGGSNFVYLKVRCTTSFLLILNVLRFFVLNIPRGISSTDFIACHWATLNKWEVSKHYKNRLFVALRDWYAFVTKTKPNGLLPETWANPFYYCKLVADFKSKPKVTSLRIHFCSLLFPLWGIKKKKKKKKCC